MHSHRGRSGNERSGGQNQRIAIAIALANEPTAALDKKRAISVVEMLKKITREQNITIIMVTHDESLFPYCDKVLHIVDKRVEVVVVEDEK